MALAWIFERQITTPALLSTVAIGVISGIALFATRRVAEARAGARRARRGENELACRYMVARWMTDPDDPVWVLFDSKDVARGKAQN